MNYRHAYHAGNFADVLKHVVLSLTLIHLAKKAAPFRVIDTHAGIGMYDLAGEEAGKTGEWRGGIGRLIGPTPNHCRGGPSNETYLVVAALIGRRPRRYP